MLFTKFTFNLRARKKRKKTREHKEVTESEGMGFCVGVVINLSSKSEFNLPFIISQKKTLKA